MSKAIDMKLCVFKKATLIIFVLSLFCFYFLTFHIYVDVKDASGFNMIALNNGYNRSLSNTTKRILFWNKMFTDDTFYFGKGDIFYDCPVNDCYATRDRTEANVEDYDAILFHGNELKLQDLPNERRSKQWYIYVNLESPENRPFLHTFYNDYFNLTMTYRLDSDILWSYGTVKEIGSNETVAPLWNTTWNDYLKGSEKKEETEILISDTMRTKRIPVSWFVSNCQGKSGRSQYAMELSKYITVDIYGKCGNYRCPRDRDCFREIVEPNYFFYLSFENSLCQDYVTEKLYNPLRYNVLPVVYGGADYNLFAPPRSYINALDFDTPKDLAEYLKRLVENPQEYQEYFRWKKYYKIEGGIRRTVCKLCQLLHENKGTKVYDHLSDWYSRGKCPIQKFLGGHKYASGSILKDPI